MTPHHRRLSRRHRPPGVLAPDGILGDNEFVVVVVVVVVAGQAIWCHRLCLLPPMMPGRGERVAVPVTAVQPRIVHRKQLFHPHFPIPSIATLQYLASPLSLRFVLCFACAIVM